MIVITGATGQFGSRVVDQLLGQIPAGELAVSVRDTDRAAHLAARGVRVRHGDFTDPGSLASAFVGADQVLVVSASTTGDEALAQHRAALDAARDAGARRVLYTSHMGAGAGSAFAPMADHAATEEHLSALGVPFTSLRNGFYASTVPRFLGRALETGELVAPADGPVSWTTHADLAAAAAIILTDEARFDGPTPPLTATDALDLEQVATILSDLSGRTIRRTVADDDAFVAQLVEHGQPEQQAQMLLGMFLASRRNEFAATDRTLEDLLRRPAQPLRAVLEKVASATQ